MSLFPAPNLLTILTFNLISDMILVASIWKHLRSDQLTEAQKKGEVLLFWNFSLFIVWVIVSWLSTNYLITPANGAIYTAAFFIIILFNLALPIFLNKYIYEVRNAVTLKH